MKKLYLSVVIPAYNEEKNIKKGALSAVYKYLKKQKYAWEMVLANDGSSDNTLKLLNKFAENKKNVVVLDEPHRGKAGIVVAGVLASKGEIILFSDMDQSTPINQFESFREHFEHNDIVIGSRSGREGAPLVRKSMATGFSLLRTLVLLLPYKDTQCGFKAFKKKAAKDIFNKIKKFHSQEIKSGSSLSAGFDIEILYLARKLGYKVEEVSVDWYYEPGTKKNPIKESWIGFKGIISVRWNALQGKYGV